MGRSSDPTSRVRGVPVYGYRRVPGVPPIGVVRGRDGREEPAGVVRRHPHAHDFLVLVYFEQDGGCLRVDEREWSPVAGDVFVVAPGEVVVVDQAGGLAAADGWAVFFPPDVVGAADPGAFLSWRSHPLLFPFVRGVAGGVQRLHVPPAGRAAFSERLAALDSELRERRDGSNEAAVAHLTLLLVAVSRLATDVLDGFVLRDEPLLAAVFDVIEERFRGTLTLADVAAQVGLTPGHLTTVVGRKTGRTVQQWITERRMVEARRLLAETDLTAEAVGARVGYRDPGYFARRFRRAHGAAPLEWRRAGRPADPRRPLGHGPSDR
ncbi:AraC family transcriptional regulator [Pseudonocardia sp. MH-G8]|uniref:helix-turn-helix domain-containing protein n=1 Tax=Pseudonocardia sp. MH-G8 TaxID=1854588 RepID=UPI000BA0499F|nr:AraC family transcriptional regulator [Pseudonocardia sp. MH-G8]OZM82865.1 AraC family transcriptional regulator [Pseudonocardia sp. MH-G8]